MNFRKLLTEDRAVSPVIGVILMVAITVILAAVIGTFVLGLGDQVSESAPQAQFTFEFGGDKNLNVTHDGGDAIEADTLEVSSSVSGNIKLSKNGTTYSSGSSSPVSLVDSGAFASGDTISAGTTVYINTANSLSGESVRIVWSSPNSDKTATIGQFQA